MTLLLKDQTIGRFLLEKAVIYVDVPFDIKDLIAEINIFEDMFQPSLTCEIVMKDTINLSEGLPFTGYHFLQLEFSNMENTAYVDLVVYGIKERRFLNDTTEAYILRAISDSYFTFNLPIRIAKSYKDMYISDIVWDIAEMSGLSENGFNQDDIHVTSGLHSCVIPNQRPYDAIQWLCSQAKDQYGNCDYVFYETLKLYTDSVANVSKMNFHNISRLKSVREGNIYKFDRQITNINIDFDRTNQGKILNMTFEKNVNSIDNMVYGLNSSRLNNYDFTTKTFTKKEYSYKNQNTVNGEFNAMFHLGGSSIIPDIDTGTYFMTSTNFRQYNPNNGGGMYHSGAPDVLQTRRSQLLQANLITLKIHVPGNTNIKVGNVIHVDVPTPFVQISPIDLSLSGRWLVVAIRHVLQFEKYTMIMEIARDAHSSIKDEKSTTPVILSEEMFGEF